jgi:very-short-patch-repair endonuclease
MGQSTVQSRAKAVWALAVRQHGAISHDQLEALEYNADAIQHRIERGRLHPTGFRGVYAVGRPELTQEGEWMAAVLACGEGAVLSHESAAQLWEIRKPPRKGPIHVSIPLCRRSSHDGIVVHRRSALTATDLTTHQNIPTTTPTATLIDLAATTTERRLEAAINEACNRDLTDPDPLVDAVEQTAPRPGRKAIRKLLATHAFALTDSELERMFLRITRKARLPDPLTQHRIETHRVDFYWPHLQLIVEADSLRFHRTPAQQLADRRRDQEHTVAGLTTLRFTHWQIARERRDVENILVAVSNRQRHILA